MKQKINLTSANLREFNNRFLEIYHLGNGILLNDSITVNWVEFKNAIEKNSGITPQDEMVLRFIHRLHDSKWFLTMECCHVNSQGVIDYTGNRFDIRDFSIVDSNFEGRFDPDYQNEVTYKGAALKELVAVRSVTFPWEQEFVEAARVNNVLFDGSINLKFVSVSYDQAGTGKLVQHPHVIAMLFSTNTGVDMVDNCTIQPDGLIAPYKAFNFGSVCPTRCGEFEYYDLFFKNKEVLAYSA